MRTKISPKSGRGLGHVTSTIFGSTVGYPSDSLASCIHCGDTLVHVSPFARPVLSVRPSVPPPVTSWTTAKTVRDMPMVTMGSL